VPTFHSAMERVLVALQHPGAADKAWQAIHASIGATFFLWDGADANALIKNADIALYRAKALGGDRAVEFEPAMAEAIERRVELRQRAHAGLAREEFELFYQPAVSLASGHVSGLEALLRWRHLTQGLLTPGQFDSVLDDPGLAAAIGRFVLDQALDQALVWSEAGVPFAKISINVSTSDFRTGAFVTQLLNQSPDDRRHRSGKPLRGGDGADLPRTQCRAGEAYCVCMRPGSRSRWMISGRVMPR